MFCKADTQKMTTSGTALITVIIVACVAKRLNAKRKSRVIAKPNILTVFF